MAREISTADACVCKDRGAAPFVFVSDAVAVGEMVVTTAAAAVVGAGKRMSGRSFVCVLVRGGGGGGLFIVTVAMNGCAAVKRGNGGR